MYGYLVYGKKPYPNKNTFKTHKTSDVLRGFWKIP